MKSTLAVSAPRVAAHDVSLALARFALWGIIAAKILGGWGVQWDIEWHVRVGRDTFWIPPHLMTYGGVTLSVLLSWGMLAWYTAGGGGPERLIRVLGIRGTRGFHLAAWGNALIVLAAPIDDLWHRLFGLDVTLWSPPHLLGILGGLVSSAACVAIAREVHREAGLARPLAQVLAGASLFRGLGLIVQPAFLEAHASGGVWFHLPAIMSAALLPLALVATSVASGRRLGPAMILVLTIGTVVVGQMISNAGFDLLRPESVIAAEVARDPTSPVAIATRISQENGEAPGRSGLALLVAGLASALAMSAVDARRRPVRAAVTYGVVFFALAGALMARAPAFASMVPPVGETLAALALTVSASAAAGWVGGALGRGLGAAS